MPGNTPGGGGGGKCCMFNFTNCMICFGVRPVEKSAGNVYRLFLGGQGPVYTATRSYKVYKVYKVAKLQSYKCEVQRKGRIQPSSTKAEGVRSKTSTHQHININSTPRHVCTNTQNTPGRQQPTRPTRTLPPYLLPWCHVVVQRVAVSIGCIGRRRRDPRFDFFCCR